MPTDVQRIQAVFLAAAEIADPADRAKFLDGACDGDAELRSRVEALLRAHDQPDSLLDHPAVAAPDADPGATEALNGTPDPGMTATRTTAGENGASDDEALAFLAPATRPDSLGRIGHYEVLQVLGKGGFGIVFRAFDEMLQRVVALKVLAPQLAATSPARKRFLREARSSAQVRHENVVQVYEVAEQPLPYLAMEFIPGETLQQRLDRVGPLERAEVVRIGRQIAEGLAAAHATDLIHRDIKPGNVLLEGGQHKVKITDFGLARAADDASISQSGIIAGTPMYMAPEQAKGETLDQRADLFSLGSVLYQMVVRPAAVPGEHHGRRAEAGRRGQAAGHPRDHPRDAAVAVRHHRQAARQEPGRPLPVGPRSGRRARRLRGPAQGQLQAEGLQPHSAQQAAAVRAAEVGGRGGGRRVASRDRPGRDGVRRGDASVPFGSAEEGCGPARACGQRRVRRQGSPGSVGEAIGRPRRDDQQHRHEVATHPGRQVHDGIVEGGNRLLAQAQAGWLVQGTPAQRRSAA